MADTEPAYAVFLFEQAVEVLGEALKPYLDEGERGAHVCCREVDTGGAFVEMVVDTKDMDGQPAEVELMIPSSMVRMIVSMRREDSFGFAREKSAGNHALPVVGPEAPPARAPSAAVPDSRSVALVAGDDRRQPPEG
jgi:hypothetical protein